MSHAHSHTSPVESLGAPAESASPDHAGAKKSVVAGKQASRLKLVLGVVSACFGLEYVGAVLSRSAVLRADALHLLMDVLALAVSLMAMHVASKRAHDLVQMRRIEAFAALFNGLLVLGVVFEIVHDAFENVESGVRPDGNLMLLVSLAALVVNGFSAWLLHGVMGHDHGHAHACDHEHAHHEHAHSHDHGHGLNLRGAFLHLIGDALGAVAAVVAAVVIRAGGPVLIDPIAGTLVAVILLVGALRLLRDATRVLLSTRAPAPAD